MKCKIIRTDIECSPAHMPPGNETQYEYRDTLRNGAIEKVPFWKNGAILEMPDVHLLVQMGCAVPADDACLLRAHRNPEELAAAQKAYNRLAKGIHPDDFELFDQEIIAGYKPDGSYDPGPQFHLLEKAAAEHEEHEDLEEE